MYLYRKLFALQEQPHADDTVDGAKPQSCVTSPRRVTAARDDSYYEAIAGNASGDVSGGRAGGDYTANCDEGAFTRGVRLRASLPIKSPNKSMEKPLGTYTWLPLLIY